MNLDDEKRRAQIAGVATLLVHAVVLLIPITVEIASNHNTQPVESEGYFTGLVDLSGSPNGQPGIGIAGSGHEGGGSTVTIEDNKKENLQKKDSAAKPGKAETNVPPKTNMTESLGSIKKEVKNSIPSTVASFKGGYFHRLSNVLVDELSKL